MQTTMKFSIVSLSLLFVATVTGATRVTEESTRRFLNDQPTDNDYAFLGNYSLKMIYCDAIEVTSCEAGTDYGSIVFRLCPSTGECIDDFGSVGCDAGYGDFLVGINTFVKAYLEHKRDEIQVVNDNFQIEEMVRMPSIQIRYGR